MKSRKIKNSQTYSTQKKDQTQNKNSSKKLNDVEITKDCLYSEDLLLYKYNSLSSEITTKNIKSCFLNILDDEHNIKNELFMESEKRNWNQTSNQVQENEINQVKQEFSQKTP